MQLSSTSHIQSFIISANMEKRPFHHRVEKTRNKHSRAVFREDTIVIRLARNLSKVEEREHIEDLLRRMTRQLLEEQSHKTTLQPFQKLLSGARNDTITLATGKKYSFRLQPGTKLGAEKVRGGWVVTISPQTRRSGLHRLLWKLVAEAEYDRIETLVTSLNKRTLRVRVRTVKLQFATSQWGSCSPKGVIMLNTALLFTPPSLLKYVIIHELAHRKRADHSPAYWKVVEKALPNYSAVRNRLHDYRLPAL